jgi:Fe-S-cluster containining protein
VSEERVAKTRERRDLFVLQAEVEVRCGAVRESQLEWLCRAGCDLCCRSLPRIPEATAEEWRLVDEGLQRLPAAIRREVDSRIGTIESRSAPFTCPFLSGGTCLVYEQRPIACRTYGFYVERGVGLYCGDIHDRAERGELDAVVWGNQCVVDARLDALGSRIPLTRWRAGNS